ncbi:hypothetical protein V2J09_020269 [Rumex salicifolius]
MSHFAHCESNGQGLEFIPFDTSNQSLKVLLLHGHLDIWVKEAKNLPNMDLFHKHLTGFFGIMPKKMSDKITSDPYVNVSISDCIVARTFVIRNTENPVWMQHFFVPVAHSAAELHFVVKDDDIVGSQIMGFVGIPVQKLYDGQRIEGIFPILNDKQKQLNFGSTLSLSIQYHPMERMSLYHFGVGSGPEYYGVPGTYFPLRKGGRITLYQDAHVEDDALPNFNLDNGICYDHGKCWSDIFQAICGARHLVYIVGWSVYHLVRLVRDAQNASMDSQLGHLLKAKAQEGVRVLLLVWDDPTSRNIWGFETDSSVRVILCPRSGGKGRSLIGTKEAEAIYTHHQKTVIVDYEASHYRRKIIAFVGGLDLCIGLVRLVEGQSDGCPREPWHDLHCQIDGPAAYDVLANFEERWIRASKRHGLQKMRSSHDDYLLKIDRIPNIIGLDEISDVKNYDKEGWHTQVFRSIDSNSVKGFPKDPKDAKDKNLVCGKNVLIDMSIQTAYVHAIRAAQHFIYIENQYFLGSSYNWDSYKDLGANNLIPIEIALKIASKIRAHERFAGYIIIPMWPEGDPKSVPTQRILFWQYKTMQMMYEIIYKALLEVGLHDKYEPQDYLNFFCLGNREVNEECGTSEAARLTDSPQDLSKKFRRFMIYVHSKGMVVDDEYVIIGSANINQHESYMSPESLDCVRRVRSIGEANWMQYAAQEVTEMRSHLLKYPLEVDRTGKVKPLLGYENFPDFGGKIMGSFNGIQENLTI